MGEPVLGLEVRLQCASANVGRRGKVVDQNVAFTDFNAVSVLSGCYVIWNLDRALRTSIIHPCMTILACVFQTIQTA